MAASGGVAAAMLMAASRLPAAPMRATMVAFLLFAGSYALLCALLLPLGTGTRLISMDTLRWALMLAPTMFLGIWIGRHSFANASPAGYRNHVLRLLIVIWALGVLRALIDLGGASWNSVRGRPRAACLPPRLKFRRLAPEFSWSINHLRWISGLVF